PGGRRADRLGFAVSGLGPAPHHPRRRARGDAGRGLREGRRPPREGRRRHAPQGRGRRAVDRPGHGAGVGRARQGRRDVRPDRLRRRLRHRLHGRVARRLLEAQGPREGQAAAAVRRGADGAGRPGVRRDGRAGASAVARRGDARGRRQGDADLVLEGELVQRMHRHGRRDLPPVPAPDPVQPGAGEGVAGAGARLRGLPALELAVRPARPGDVPRRDRSGLRRRRADRGEPDARRGERQHAADARGHRPRREERRLRRQVLARADQVGRVLRARGLRPGEPALHRRLLRPPGAQRESLRQGDPRHGRLRPHGRDARRGRRRQTLHRPGQGAGAEVDGDGRRRRPLPPDVRPPGELEPEVQPDLGQDPGVGRLPPGGRRQGAEVLRHEVQRVRPAAGQPQGVHQERLARLDGLAGAGQGDVRQVHRPHAQVPERHARPGAVHRLVLDRQRQGGRLPRPAGHRRDLHPRPDRRPPLLGELPGAGPRRRQGPRRGVGAHAGPPRGGRARPHRAGRAGDVEVRAPAAAGQLDLGRLRRPGLEAGPERLRHQGHARRGREHRLGRPADLAPSRDRRPQGGDRGRRRPAAVHPPRRGRRGLVQRRPRRPPERLHQRVPPDAHQPRGPQGPQAGQERRR
ncbi:hypothetical protein HK102_009896, partial [Quaeritorhiza haematococci]